MTRRPDRLVVGRIATLDGDRGFGWAEAVAISDRRVVATGSLDDLEGLADTRTRRIELAPDEVAIPGLTDAHLHLGDAATARSQVDLSTFGSRTEVLAAIGDAHAGLADREAWLLGGGWDIDQLSGWPTAHDLEEIAPGRRVALWSRDHHAVWASVEALEAARVGERTADPTGGRIRRAADGRPEGVLQENATFLVTARVPPPTADALERSVRALANELLRLGVLAVHDPGSLLPDPTLAGALVAYGRLDEAGRLPTRVHLSIRADGLPAALERGFRSGQPIGAAPDPHARVGWLKLFADGTLGSRTAVLLDRGGGVGSGRPGGVYLTEPSILARLSERAAGAGIATQIHAIGDAAVRAALDALEPLSDRSTVRPRIEHVQLLDDADRARFAASRIVASVQPIHIRTDAAAARREWGDRADARGYAYGALDAAGAVLAFGTDAPVEPVDPWPGLEIAATRRSPDWPDDVAPLGPAQALALDRVLRAACLGPAVAAAEADRGRLVPGARADLVVIPAAALAEPVEPGGPLGRVRPRLVVFDGQVVAES